MKYVAAYLLLVLGGNQNPSEADVTKVLTAGKVEVDNAAVAKIVAELKGKNVYDVIDEGKSKLTSVPVASGPRSASSGAAAAPAAGKAEEKAPEAEKPKDESEESEGDMGFGLFD